MSTDYFLQEPIMLDSFLAQLPEDIEERSLLQSPREYRNADDELVVHFVLAMKSDDEEFIIHGYARNGEVQNFARYGRSGGELILTRLFNLGILGEMKSEIGEVSTSKGFFFLDDKGNPVTPG